MWKIFVFRILLHIDILCFAIIVETCELELQTQLFEKFMFSEADIAILHYWGSPSKP